MRLRLLTLALLLLPVRASAEWQVKPFLGFTAGGSTTLVDLEHASGKPNVAIGVSGLLLGDVLGVEADFGYAPGFFQTGRQLLVLQSSVTTLTASIVVAAPRRATEYTLRPYFVGGGGMMHVQAEHAFGVLQVDRTLPVLDVGGGVTGFITDRFGVSWDLRWFGSVGTGSDRGLSIGREQLSFWRANMAFAFRY